MTKIIVVDDHNFFRMMLRTTLQLSHPDICMTGEAATAGELFRLLPHTEADLVVLDINLPDVWGVDVTRRLRRDYPQLKIIAVSGENTSETIHSMIEAGIDGFISKQYSGVNDLADAIESVMNGVEYFGRDISAILFDIYVAKKKTSAVTAEFTEREREIILLSRDGLLCKEIADRMNISVFTVNSHKRNIFLKLGISSTMEMVQYALKHGIIRMRG
ncbi:MAG: response regulator transcription factor [Tannerella sp.]|jgi:DNA-binding NarL/FixJ family response regulator|nr:response regulator transcription factor [Tannerella sp.]